ncbi:anthranilate synthase component I family protein [Paenibacillus filicis]|uniref:Anthranilate synthase component I family protein n=1 Tax=Paenibacillus gyeongsangnamensis TaxID=3388067 RepID=A0ABT4QL76_9BACL|nr:anthranilate synthase component I family protein [Paenibacillus filicis]MCZ8517595.1 anthranilate synthase component I family protein [Paenibacillus filicis]
MVITSYGQWLEWSQTYSALPYVESFPLSEDESRVMSWEAAWTQASPGSFVLESGKGGRYSFLGLRPISAIRGTVKDAEVSCADGRKEAWQGAPLELVKRWMDPFRAPRVDGTPKFVGGCVGFWGYDVVRSIEKLPVLAKDDLPVPDYAFVQVGELWIVDHEESKLYCAVHVFLSGEAEKTEEQLQERYTEAQRQIAHMKRVWDLIHLEGFSENSRSARADKRSRMARDVLQIDVDAIAGITPDFPREDYIRAVERIQAYISAGDVFQVNLSVRQHKPLRNSPEAIYEWLRQVNPSPYMGLLRFDDFQLVSGSPELLVQLEGNKVRTRPIAGTRPRGDSPEEDRLLSEELLLNDKERAEHIMLVDLERNDLGRISEYGSVRVKDLMVIERYSHVMHIVSEVEGKLAPGKDAYDVIAATFPGGTITGAPKIRTMEIIEELEPVRRGPYTGSIGWIDYNGNMEFNIIIRTLLMSDGIGYVQAGAGIVIDSVPEKEYTESINKAKAMWKAIQYSEQSSCAAGGNKR